MAERRDEPISQHAGLHERLARLEQENRDLRARLERKAFLADLLNLSAQAVGVGYPDGRIGFVNPAFEQLTGYTAQELQTLNWSATFTPLEWRAIEREQLRQLFRTGSPVCYEAEFFRKDGSRVPVELLVQLVTDKLGSPACYYAFVTDISERKQTFEALKDREEALQRYKLLAQNSRDIALFVRKSDGRILEANEAACRAYGFSYDELLQLTIFDIRAPDFIGPTLAQMAVADTQGVLFETEHRRRNGSTFPVEVSSRGVDVGGERVLLSLVRDITRRKRAEAELKRNAELEHGRLAELEAMMEAVPAAVMISRDPQCRLITGNRTAYELLRLPFGVNLSRHVNDGEFGHFRIFHDERDITREDLALEWAAATGVPVFNFDKELVFDQGERVSVFGNAIPLFDSDGNPAGAVAAFVDITSRVKAEQEVRRAQQAAEAANTAKSAFLASLSHEIRTPLNAIIGSLQLLEFTPLSSEQRGYLGEIMKSSRGMLTLLNQVLDLSKIEAGGMTLEITTFSLRTTIAEVITTLQSLAQEKGLFVDSIIPADLPDSLQGDQFRLKQVLLNLLSNAIKFTEAGCVLIAASVVERDDDRVMLELSVKDSGIGIVPQALDVLFEPFVQAESDTSRRYGGTGLGLAICKKLVGVMGGELWAESTEGVGSTFFLRIPLTVVADAHHEAAYCDYTPYVQPEWDGPLLRILLADDNETNLMFTGELLELFGHTVIRAGDGQEVLQAWEQHDFDIILMDISMPVLSGTDATRIIREKERLAGKRHLPIVALTAHALLEEQQQLTGQGFDGCLIKPVQLDELLQELKRQVRK